MRKIFAKQHMKGQTMIEALVALTAAVVIITVITATVISSLNNAQFSKNQSAATQYAQAGMETLVQMRDSDYATFATYSGGYCFGADKVLRPICGGANVSNFYRTVQIQQGGCGANIAQVTVTAGWNDNKCSSPASFCHSSQLNECLATVYNFAGAVAQPTPVPSNGYVGQYYNNINLAGSPALTRLDSAINFDWGFGSPDPSIQSSEFSVRWTKTDTFSGGFYQFNAHTVDGSRLIVDGTTVMYDGVNGSMDHTITLNLTAGNHTIVFEYVRYNTGFGHSSSVHLTYAQTGTPTISETDRDQNPSNSFWTKNDTLAAGTYQFVLSNASLGCCTTDLYIDNALVGSVPGSAMSLTVNKTVSAGVHSIKVDTREPMGGNSLHYNQL